jgi:hypothetical protein
MNRKILVLALAFLISLSIAYAGDLARAGTTSGTQLLIPVGARSLALGGAVLGEVSGAEAMYWNPAGIAYSQKSEILFNNMSYIGDTDLNYLALVFNGRSIGAFGLDIKSLSFGDIEETTELEPDGTGKTYSPSFVVVGLSYSRLITDRIAAGVTGKVIHEGIMQTSASTLAFDLGVQYTFGTNIKVGVVMKNVGGKLKYSGSNLERSALMPSNSLIRENGYFSGVALAADIPSVFSFGVSYTANFNEDNAFLISGAFNNHNAASDDLYGGLQYGFKNFFFLRGGYNYQVQNSDNQIFGASFGAGLRYQLSSFVFVFDYAFRQLTDYFDSNNIFTIKLMF